MAHARGKFATFLLKKHSDGIIAYVVRDMKINSPRAVNGKLKIESKYSRSRVHRLYPWQLRGRKSKFPGNLFSTVVRKRKAAH